MFVSAIPALYQLKLLDTPKADFWRIVSLTAVGGYFGFFFATPLRKFFIIYVARELRLIFPSASATAMTIRRMHAATTGEAAAKAKMKALSIAFAIAFVLRVVSQYAVGILWDWHVSNDSTQDAGTSADLSCGYSHGSSSGATTTTRPLQWRTGDGTSNGHRLSLVWVCSLVLTWRYHFSQEPC